nr:MAG TPA: hypothetical protein [Caudoviricetes sp.]
MNMRIEVYIRQFIKLIEGKVLYLNGLRTV